MLRTSSRAQASIEYMTIMTLVVSGIVLMGPYVLRAINAHFKSTDDQIQDSFSEEIRHADDPNYQLPECNCGDFVVRGCGPGPSSGFCTSPYATYRDRTCSPAGCENEPGFQARVGPTKVCEPDVTCCTDLVDDLCGRFGGLDNDGNPCPPTFMSQVQTCAFGTETRRTCVDRTLTDCRFQCTSPPPPAAGALLCPGDNSGLAADTPYVLVAGLSCTSYTPADAPKEFTWGTGASGPYYVFVRVWGGGGHGAGRRQANTTPGGGGGGGGYAEGVFALQAGATYRVHTVGAGGSGNAAGVRNGTSSNFRRIVGATVTTLINANGGTGLAATTLTGGGGGTATIHASALSPRTQTGQTGGNANVTAVGDGGKGGDSGLPLTGGGAAGLNCIGASPACTPDPQFGSVGSAPGGGGGGGGDGANNATGLNTGRGGADGRIDICFGNGGCTDARFCETYCPPPSIANAAATACILPREQAFSPPLDCDSSSKSTVYCCPNANTLANCNLGSLMCHPTSTVTSVYVRGIGCDSPVATVGATCTAVLW